MILISRMFYFRIIREVLNSRASIRVVSHFRWLKLNKASKDKIPKGQKMYCFENIEPFLIIFGVPNLIGIVMSSSL